MPTAAVTEADTADGLLAMLVKIGFIPSKSEGRRLLQQGGLTVNGEKVTADGPVSKDAFGEDGMIVKRGKKAIIKITLS